MLATWSVENGQVPSSKLRRMRYLPTYGKFQRGAWRTSLCSKLSSKLKIALRIGRETLSLVPTAEAQRKRVEVKQ
jgi:hypothetical protein